MSTASAKQQVWVPDFNRSFRLRPEDRKPQWKLVDAKGKTLGRLATEIANVLRGKDEAFYTPHTDSGDYVVVINARDIVLTGKKSSDKMYQRYTGWLGGLKETSAQEMRAKHPDRLIWLAVRGMLPKNRLSRYILRKLRVYGDDKHGHQAQFASN